MATFRYFIEELDTVDDFTVDDDSYGTVQIEPNDRTEDIISRILDEDYKILCEFSSEYAITMLPGNKVHLHIEGYGVYEVGIQAAHIQFSYNRIGDEVPSPLSPRAIIKQRIPLVIDDA